MKIKTAGTGVLGIDPSSTRLAAVYSYTDGKRLEVFTEPLPVGDRVRECRLAYDWLDDLMSTVVEKSPVTAVFVEQPVLGRGGAGATIPQAMVHGALLASGYLLAQYVVSVNPARWKKAVLGKGNATKPEIAEWVKINWPEVFEVADGNQDVLDSACINLYGRQVVALRQRIMQHKETP